jgi:hypothetical protein
MPIINQKKPMKFVMIFIVAVLLICFLGIQHGIFNKYNFVTALIDSSKNNNKIIVVGELDPYDQYRIVIAPAFHFSYIFYGCSSTYSLDQGIKDYNALMINKIKKINGNEWDVKFRNELIKMIIKNNPKEN